MTPAQKENLPGVETLDAALLRLRNERNQLQGKLTKLLPELTRTQQYIADTLKNISEPDPDPVTAKEEKKVLEIALKHGKDKEVELKNEIESTKEVLETVKKDLLGVEEEIRAAKDDDSGKGGVQKIPGKKNKKEKKDPAKDNSGPADLQQAIDAAQQAALNRPAPAPKPPTPPQKPAPKPASKNPVPPAAANNPAPSPLNPAPQGKQPNTPEKITWIDTAYSKDLEGGKNEIKESKIEEREKKLAASSNNTEKEILKKEISIYTEHFNLLTKIQEIIAKGDRYEYGLKMPQIPGNIADLIKSSSWRDRSWAIGVKREIDFMLKEIEKIHQSLKNRADIPTAYSEMAIRQLHTAELWKILNKALVAAKQAQAAPSPAPVATPQPVVSPSPAPAAAAPLTPSGHNTQATVQSNTTMATHEKEFGDKALDTAGFAQYAAEAGAARGQDVEGLEESISTEDPSGVLLYETHQKLEKFSADLKDLFRKDARGIIEYQDADFASIDAYLQANRVTNPEIIVDLMEKIETAKQDKKVIEEKEAQIQELTRQRDAKIAEYTAAQVKERHDAIAAGKTTKYLNERKNKGLGFFNFIQKMQGRYWLESTGRETINAELQELNTNAEQLAVNAGITGNLDDQLAQLEMDKRDFSDRHTQLRGELLQNSEYAQEIHTLAQQKVIDRMNAMLVDQDKNLSAIDEHQSVLELINEMRESGSSFAYLNDTDAENVQRAIDKEAEETAQREIIKAVDAIKLDKSNQYTIFENTLKTIINREQLGSKATAESKQFIIDTIGAKVQEYKKKDPARALYLQRLVGKIRDLKI